MPVKPHKNFACVTSALLTLLLGAVIGQGKGRSTIDYPVGHNTFVYATYEIGSAPGKFFAGFRQTSGGLLIPVPLAINAHDILATPIALTATPDGHSLYAECYNTSADGSELYTPYFLELSVLPNGQLKQQRRVGVDPLKGAHHLAFGPSGRYAYLLSSPRLGAGSVLRYRMGPIGQFLGPPASAPCGIVPQGLAIGHGGRALYTLDFQGGRLWQYGLNAQGAPVPMQPPFLPIGRMRGGPVVTPSGVYVADDKAVYGFRAGAGGALSPLPPLLLSGNSPLLSITPLGANDLAVSLLRKTLVLRVGLGGTLRRVATLPGGTTCYTDPAGHFLYKRGLHTRLYVYRIRADGRPVLVHGPPVTTGTLLTSLVFVRRFP